MEAVATLWDAQLLAGLESAHADATFLALLSVRTWLKSHHGHEPYLHARNDALRFKEREGWLCCMWGWKRDVTLPVVVHLLVHLLMHIFQGIGGALLLHAPACDAGCDGGGCHDPWLRGGLFLPGPAAGVCTVCSARGRMEKVTEVAGTGMHGKGGMYRKFHARRRPSYPLPKKGARGRVFIHL